VTLVQHARLDVVAHLEACVSNARVNDAAVLAAVTAVHDQYEAALMANDIETLDRLFWDSPETLRFGATEASYGAAAIAGFRRARSAIGLARTVAHFKAVTFGDDIGITTVEFDREVGGVPRHGRQTQVWRRFDEGGWKIVSAHVSLVDEGGDLEQAARRVGLDIPPSHRAGVQRQLARTTALAGLVTGFPLADDVEAAPVFCP
jgi:hypothetical protein